QCGRRTPSGDPELRARQEIRCTFCCWPAGRSPEGRGGEGRVSAVLPLLDDATTSPASRRLASARPALAPKCTPYFLTGPYIQGDRRTERASPKLPFIKDAAFPS